MARVGDEIVKAAVMPQDLNDVGRLFDVARELDCRSASEPALDRILIGMGDMGVCTRILAKKLGSHLMYTWAKETNHGTNAPAAPGQLDPRDLVGTYRFREITKSTAVFGILGWPLNVTESPAFFNSVFTRERMDAVYVPFPSETVAPFLALADKLKLLGASVTVPHKQEIIGCLSIKTD
jgi:3-dehydroquinate dehydratase/shikimate dehydrogenase